MNRLPLLLVGIVLTCMVGAQISQTPSVTEPPPKIAFDTWREVDRNDSSVEYLVSFPSPLISSVPNNNIVPLRLFLPDPLDKPVPVVLVFHYWGAMDIRAERSMAYELNRLGVAAAIMTLPYHLSRTPPGEKSGKRAIEPDPEKLRLTMTQAVLDAKRALDYLDTRPEFRHDKVGVAGTSLGSLVAELTYAMDPRISRATFVLGGADLAYVIWTSALVVPQREIMKHQGVTLDTLREDLASVEPLTYLGNRPPTPVFVVAGKYDTVIPRPSTDRLLNALPQAKTLWLETGHYGGIFIEHAVLRQVASYFAQEFAGRSYVPPKHIYAPTIRVGALTTIPFEFDLGAGLDLWRSNRSDNTFATFFLTPRGPQLFFGSQIAQGLSFGISGSTRRVGIGLFWSTVL